MLNEQRNRPGNLEEELGLKLRGQRRGLLGWVFQSGEVMKLVLLSLRWCNGANCASWGEHKSDSGAAKELPMPG